MASVERLVRDIRPIDDSNLAALGAYLEDHLKDNGQAGTPLFQPQSRAAPWPASDKIALFKLGLGRPVGNPGWRRGWIGLDASGSIIGHVDFRGHADPYTAHRALLGMGVHRSHRGRGLGRALVTLAISWATTETEVEWLDLKVLAGNVAAEHLYRTAGFNEVATVRDMFRVDGRSVDNILMTMRLTR